MVPFEMQMDARLMLARMSVIYEREVGGKIRMSRDEGIVTLVNYAVESINGEIKRQFEQFITLLTPGEAKALAAKGANIYRGVVVKENSEPFQSDYFDKQQNAGIKMYRGVPVSGKGDAMAAGKAATEAKSAANKVKRVYRGRVIED